MHMRWIASQSNMLRLAAFVEYYCSWRSSFRSNETNSPFVGQGASRRQKDESEEGVRRRHTNGPRAPYLSRVEASRCRRTSG